MEIGLLKQMARRLSLRNTYHPMAFKVLIISNLIRWDRVENLDLDGRVIILGLANLLYLAGNHEKLKERLLSMIDYTIDDVVPQAPVFHSTGKAEDEKKDQGDIGKTEDQSDIKEVEAVNETIRRIDGYISEIKNWDVSRKSGEYEKLCAKILKELFMNEKLIIMS